MKATSINTAKLNAALAYYQVLASTPQAPSKVRDRLTDIVVALLDDAIIPDGMLLTLVPANDD